MKMQIEHILPSDIEKRSFEIIRKELSESGVSIPEDIEQTVVRVIHTTADFEYTRTLMFSENVIEKARKAIREGACIVTDTNMALSGINKKSLAKFGGEVFCFMADEEVARQAKERQVTRAYVSMEKAAGLGKKLIFAIGNAPTALIKLRELMDEGYRPELIIGVPVGFVNVVEAKELIIDSDVPYIVNRGRKGGSNVAAAIVNSILYSIDSTRGM
ncbi:MAG: precorrin-8X methylmutase [Butyrivibrio sp.]|nr:precorrin-8X methylmutase [Butyrivibrio sp.]